MISRTRNLPPLMLCALCATLITSAAHAGVFPAGVAPQKLASGIASPEGPARDANDNVYFSDRNVSTIRIWTSGGTLVTWTNQTGGANGLWFHTNGMLYAAEQTVHRVATYAPTTVMTPLVTSYNGASFNTPNDIWVAPDGGVYFSDPNWPWNGGPQAGSHVYYLAPGTNQATRLNSGAMQPNGVIGTPDGKRLYVGDDQGRSTLFYRIQMDGTITDRKLLHRIKCDGMSLDDAGNVFICNWEGRRIYVFNEDGVSNDAVAIPEQCWNATRFGANLEKLFVTAGTSIYSVALVPRKVYRENILRYEQPGAMIASALPSNNFGAADLLHVGSSALSGGTCRAVYSFLITNLPPGAIVTNAVLKLRAVAKVGSVASVQVHLLDTDFVEGIGNWSAPSSSGVTWLQSADGTPWTAGGAYDATPVVTLSITGTINETPLYAGQAGIASAVQTAVDAGEPFSFILRSTDAETAGGENYILFGADNQDYQTRRPMLVLDVVPEPAATAVVALSALFFAARKR